jgi:signal transduction histidine kinase
MTVHGKNVGAMALFFCDKGTRFQDEDLPFFQELSFRAALSLDKSRLYRQAQEAIQARDDIIAVITHDLKNPLAAIQLNAQLLSRLMSQSSVLEQPFRKHVDRITRSVTEMRFLISNLLDFDKLRAGLFSLEPRENEVPPLIERCIGFVEPLAAAKSLKLQLEVEASLPAIYCDPDRVCQVFSNVVGNAIKFTDPGGQIRLEARNGTEEVVFSITDNGPGIDPSHLPHIFTRYWQAKSTAKLGYGLGLFIAKGIVEAHRGRIWVESTPGVGTRFSFSLPTRRKGAQTPPPFSGQLAS